MTDDSRVLLLSGLRVEAFSTTAFKGAHGRVHATSCDALIDLATEKLALKWLDSCVVNQPSFATLMSYIERCPDVFAAAVDLARYIEASKKSGD